MHGGLWLTPRDGCGIGVSNHFALDHWDYIMPKTKSTEKIVKFSSFRSPGQEGVEDAQSFGDNQISPLTDDDAVFLPYALQMYRMKNYAAAAAFLLSGLVGTIALKNALFLILLLGCVYFSFRGYAVYDRFCSGQIREVPVLCTSVQLSKIRSRAILTFRTEPEDSDEEQEYFRFTNHVKNDVAAFSVGRPYLIYFDQSDTHSLLAYAEL